MLNFQICQILYDYQFDYHNFFDCLLISFFMFVAMFFLIHRYKTATLKFNKITFCFLSICAISAGVIGLVACAGNIIQHNQCIQVIEEKTYSIVIGEVNSFIPRPYEGHQDESFYVNEIEFHYSDSSLGYNDTFYYDGVIRENGQMVKLWYYFDGERNVILRIESVESSEFEKP